MVTPKTKQELRSLIMDRHTLSDINTEYITDMSGLFYKSKYLRSEYPGIKTWNTSKVTNMAGMFEGCEDLENNVSFHLWDVSNVRDMSSMFENCKNFSSTTLMSWDVSKVENMARMFKNCFSFKGDGLLKWNTKNVKNMKEMFYMCKDFNDDLSKWDVSNVLNMDSMFYMAVNFDSDLSKWNTKNVISMSKMFAFTRFSTDISKWNISKVIDMTKMFENSTFDADLSKWKLDKKCVTTNMFKGSKIDPNKQPPTLKENYNLIDEASTSKESEKEKYKIQILNKLNKKLPIIKSYGKNVKVKIDDFQVVVSFTKQEKYKMDGNWYKTFNIDGYIDIPFAKIGLEKVDMISNQYLHDIVVREIQDRINETLQGE